MSRYGRRGGRSTTAEYRRIDVRQMQRKGTLHPGSYSSWKWLLNDDVTGSISARADWDSVVLTYRYQRYGEEWQPVECCVMLEWTPCFFGGKRAWFLCPRPGCGRRVATLWGGAMFYCRQCHNLAYESQNEAPHSRALTKAQAIRVKLGGEPGFIYDFPPKPKGMHWRTYYRLREQSEEAEGLSWPPWIYRVLERNA